MRCVKAVRTLSGAQRTGETYDLIVVGGGLSGLAAAHFFLEGCRPRRRGCWCSTITMISAAMPSETN